MTKRNVKRTLIALSLTLCLITSVAVFAACDNGGSFTSTYAEAQSNWYSASNKVVKDSLTIDGELGSGENAAPVKLTLSGYRAYIGGEWEMHYTLYATGIGDAIDNILIESALNHGAVSIDAVRASDGTITLNVNLIDSTVLSVSVAESVIHDYLPVFDFDDNMFYDAESISGSAESFTISADASLGYILWQIAPVISNNFGFDVLPMLDRWLTLSDVTGSVSFDGGNFSAMSTSQDITLVLPDEDADFLAYNVDNFPDIVMSFFETKKLSIAGFNLDFSAIFAEGISLSATVSSSAEYDILGSDATFESVAAVYGAEAQA